MRRLLPLLLLVLPACGADPASAGRGRGVLLIAIDGLRADHLGSFGYDRDTSPNLARLAKQSVTFKQAWSTAPWALPAHVSLLTGCDPNAARRMLPPGVPETLLTVWHAPDDLPRLAKEYLREGYRTAAFFEHPAFSPVHGFAEGFETYTVLREGEPPLRTPSLQVAGTFARWLRGLSPSQDWMAYLQLEDLGGIWRKPEPQWDTYYAPRPGLEDVPPVAHVDSGFFAIPRHNWSGGLKSMGEYEAQYDGAIRRIDESMGWLFKRLIRERRMQTTTIVVVGTHGMDFGEAGLILDHGTLSEGDLHVPLLVRPAEEFPSARGRSTDALVSLVDVAPTLLELSRIPVPPAMQGLSFVDVLRGESVRPRRQAFASCGLQEGYAVMTDRWTFEARMPGLRGADGLRASWYGDEQEHLDDYCELLYERSQESPPACRGRPVGSALAAELREAGRENFERTHELRTRFQSSGWGARAEEVQMVPSRRLWTRAQAAGSR